MQSQKEQQALTSQEVSTHFCDSDCD